MYESATLFRIATQIEEHAASVRRQARRLAAASAQLRWHSFAADRFRAQTSHSTEALHRSAAGLERAAAALRSHARAVRRVEEVAQAIEHVGEQVANGVSRAGRFVSGWL